MEKKSQINFMTILSTIRHILLLPQNNVICPLVPLYQMIQNSESKIDSFFTAESIDIAQRL